MKSLRLAPWILAAILASTACHGPEAELVEETPSITQAEKQPTTTAKAEEQPTTTAKIEIEERPSTTSEAGEQPSTTKVEECSWCPAPDPSGTAFVEQPATSPQADLIDQLQSAVRGTVFADVSEDQLLSDIGAVCTAWQGDTSLEDAAAQVSQARTELLGASESEPGSTAYTQLLETSADHRCLRDPTR